MTLRVSADTAALARQIEAEAARMIAALLAARAAPGGRRDWYSPRALWPDMFAGGGHGE